MTIYRQLNDLAVAAGRSRLSRQTQFVHHIDAIPTVDNFLFALALLKQRSKESVTEAKELLTRLLPFQTKEGLFPNALHEYPNGNPRLNGPLLATLYWILDGYRTVLGADLRNRLETVAKDLVEADEPQSLKGCSAAYAMGLIKEKPVPPTVPLTGHAMAEALAASQILKEEWPEVRDQLSQIVHHRTGFYNAPPQNEQQAGGEPAVSLLDLQIAALSEELPQRAIEPQRVHLQGAWIHPFETPLLLTEEAPYTYGVGEGVRLVWGDRSLVRSLLVAGGKPVEQRKDAFSVEGEALRVFVPLLPDLEIRVNGDRATCFSSGDRVTLREGAMMLTLSFTGSERLTGHIHRGNRPGQLLTQGDERFTAYDWHIFLRGEGAARLTVEIGEEENGDRGQITDSTAE